MNQHAKLIGISVRSLIFSTTFLVTSFLLLSCAWAQVIDNVDPTVEQFPIVRGAGDPDYTGSLNFSIPLMTVPGIQGLNYDITLQYIDGNGVPISQSASWVGLGWNLQDYEITCNPVNEQYGTNSYYYVKNDIDDPYAPSNVPDFYSLYYPRGYTQFWLGSSGKFECVRWSAIRIQGIEDGTSKEYKAFIVYGVDGTKYVFADRLRKASAGVILWNHDLVWPSGPAYYYVFKLSAILAPDYVDGGGVWYTPGDGGGDKGAWVVLNYSTPVTYSCDTYPQNPQEVDYLSSIVTPTYTASFVTSSTQNNPFIIDNLTASGKYLYSLNRIELRRNNQPTVIKAVDFFQSNSFEWLTSSDGETEWYDPAHTLTSDWRIRLDSVRIAGINNTIYGPSYKFDYYQSGVDFSGNTPYYIDAWGYLTSEYGQAYPQQWYEYGMLEDVTYPMGAKLQLTYGPNFFQPSQFFMLSGLSPIRSGSNLGVRAGGLRIQQQAITDPQTNQQQVYQYTYGDSNNYMRQQYAAGGLSYPGVGFVDEDPGKTGTATESHMIGPSIYTAVTYPDVTIKRPDGSKIVKLFTAGCTDVQLASNNDYKWMFYDGSGEPTIQFSNSVYEPNLGPFNGYWYTMFPFVYTNPGGMTDNLVNVFSYHGTSFPWIDYPYSYTPGGDCVTNGVNGTELCELLGLDDCTMNTSCYTFFVETVGINNSWKRGYPICEQEYSSSGSPVQSKYYYYSMTLEAAQDYVVNPNGTSPYFIHFTNCSGRVDLLKTVEQKY